MVAAMNAIDAPPADAPARRGFSSGQVVALLAGAVLVAVVATLVVARTWLFPAPFEPVVLDAAERRSLDVKLDRLAGGLPARGDDAARPDLGESDADWLRPEAYGEAGARRELAFSEREINALIAADPGLSRRLAVDLAPGLASARALVTLDPGLPLVGGRTVRVAAGLGLAYRRGRPVVELRGVSVMGVPVPNAWLGNLKNVDLVDRFGDAGPWRGFADGIEDIQVEDGRLRVRLRE